MAGKRSQLDLTTKLLRSRYSDLNITEKAVLVQLSTYGNGNGNGIRPSLGSLAKDLNSSSQVMQRNIVKLRDKGYISFRSGGIAENGTKLNNRYNLNLIALGVIKPVSEFEKLGETEVQQQKIKELLNDELGQELQSLNKEQAEALDCTWSSRQTETHSVNLGNAWFKTELGARKGRIMFILGLLPPQPDAVQSITQLYDVMPDYENMSQDSDLSHIQ